MTGEELVKHAERIAAAKNANSDAPPHFRYWG